MSNTDHVNMYLAFICGMLIKLIHYCSQKRRACNQSKCRIKLNRGEGGVPIEYGQNRESDQNIFMGYSNLISNPLKTHPPDRLQCYSS